MLPPYLIKKSPFSHLKRNGQFEIKVCVEYLPDYFKKVTSAFEVNSVFKFEPRVPWALPSSSMWQAKVCQLEVGKKRGEEIISMRKWRKN